MVESVEELRARLLASEKAEQQVALDEANEIPMTREWWVTWKTEHSFQAGCRYTDETWDAIQVWKQKHPKINFPRYVGNANMRESMMYVLIGDLMVSVSGGSCVLKANDDRHVDRQYEPRKLTPEEVESLHNSIVPDSLKAWS